MIKFIMQRFHITTHVKIVDNFPSLYVASYDMNNSIQCLLEVSHAGLKMQKFIINDLSIAWITGVFDVSFDPVLSHQKWLLN